MPATSLEFTPHGKRGMSCVLTTFKGWELKVSGELDEAVPAFAGHPELTRNQVITTNVWAFACSEKERRLARQSERRRHFEKRAKLHSELARNVADLVECVGQRSRRAWCSACFHLTTHTKVEGRLEVPTYICGSCGAATLTCAAPRCPNMATRGFGAIRVPRFCAEHRHEIPSFKRGRQRLREISDFEAFVRPEKANLARMTKVGVGALVAAGAMTGVGLAAAPLVGGALGSLVGGYSGAAATSYGLALLGGGSLAAGGLGMAGGTVVVMAAGGALGSYMGASLTNAHAREDTSFAIEKLAD